MITLRRSVGFVLLLGTAISVVQSIRELAFWEIGRASCDQVWPQGNQFVFAGRVVTVRGGGLASTTDSTMVRQERVFIDGVAVGEDTDMRMSGWPVSGSMRSPHWFAAVKFTGPAPGDSAFWLARRLQRADSVRPIFEIVTIDARGQYSVQRRTEHELRTEYRVARVTQFLGEDAPSGFPFAMTGFLYFPVLLLIHPIGTVILGARLLRGRRSSRAGV